jgi:hypothetical protein
MAWQSSGINNTEMVDKLTRKPIALLRTLFSIMFACIMDCLVANMWTHSMGLAVGRIRLMCPFVHHLDGEEGRAVFVLRSDASDGSPTAGFFFLRRT